MEAEADEGDPDRFGGGDSSGQEDGVEVEPSDAIDH